MNWIARLPFDFKCLSGSWYRYRYLWNVCCIYIYICLLFSIYISMPSIKTLSYYKQKVCWVSKSYQAYYIHFTCYENNLLSKSTISFIENTFRKLPLHWIINTLRDNLRGKSDWKYKINLYLFMYSTKCEYIHKQETST